MTISLETIATIEKFTNLVKRASQSKSKDIRMDITDAIALVAELANISTKLAVTNSQNEVNLNGVHIDSGKF